MITEKNNSESFYKLPDYIDGYISEYANQVDSFVNGDLTAKEFKGIGSFNGIYEQRTDKTYMLRVRVSAGRLTLPQAKLIAELAESFSKGPIHVTSRQDLQLHDVDIKDSPEIMRELKKVDLALIGGGGNSVRNIIVSPLAGINSFEPFDVTPFAHELTEFMLSNHQGFKMPRKFKIAFSSSSGEADIVQSNDLGFQAEVRDGDIGFKVYAGGGMGAKPRIADLIYDWIPATEIIRVAEAARRLFETHGDHDNRNRARFRFVFERFGLAKMLLLFDEERIKILKDGIPACEIMVKSNTNTKAQSAMELVSKPGILPHYPQSQKGYVAVPIRLSGGLIHASDFKKLTDIVESFSAKRDLRTTRDQDFLLSYVKYDDLDKLKIELGNLDQDLLSTSYAPYIVTCPGPTTCRIGICASRETAETCAKVIDEAGLSLSVSEGVEIKISGCPNACGLNLIAPIGFSGLIRRENGYQVPSYKVMINMGGNSGKTELSSEIGILPAKSLPEFLVRLLREFKEAKQGNETFPAYAKRRGKEYFIELTNGGAR